MVIYSRSGDFVRNLADESLAAGNYSFSWDGRDAASQRVSSGIYLVKIKLGIKEVTKKIVVVR
jgi:flagellar hook assembly protein FlgD